MWAKEKGGEGPGGELGPALPHPFMEEYFMKPKGLRIGTKVRVQEELSRNPYLRGWVGQIMQRYGDASYAAFEVWFSNGRKELFWYADLEIAE